MLGYKPILSSLWLAQSSFKPSLRVADRCRGRAGIISDLEKHPAEWLHKMSSLIPRRREHHTWPCSLTKGMGRSVYCSFNPLVAIGLPSAFGQGSYHSLLLWTPIGSLEIIMSEILRPRSWAEVLSSSQHPPYISHSRTMRRSGYCCELSVGLVQ